MPEVPATGESIQYTNEAGNLVVVENLGPCDCCGGEDGGCCDEFDPPTEVVGSLSVPGCCHPETIEMSSSGDLAYAGFPEGHDCGGGVLVDTELHISCASDIWTVQIRLTYRTAFGAHLCTLFGQKTGHSSSSCDPLLIEFSGVSMSIIDTPNPENCCTPGNATVTVSQ